MSATQHEFTSRVAWTGDRGEGTRAYRSYDRTWDIAAPGQPLVHCSNDPGLGGDPGLPNPEELLLASLAACHMLWYLHYASEAGIVVLAYEDAPIGIGEATAAGAGRFVRVVLRPRITLAAGADLARAEAIHHEIGRVCFIARSVGFPIEHQPRFVVRD